MNMVKPSMRLQNKIPSTNTNTNTNTNTISYFLLYESTHKNIQFIKNSFVTFNTENGIIGQFLSDLWFNEIIHNLEDYRFYIMGIDKSNNETVHKYINQYNINYQMNENETFDKYMNQNVPNIFLLNFELTKNDINNYIEQLNTTNENVSFSLTKTMLQIMDSTDMYKLTFSVVPKHRYQRNINNQFVFSTDPKYEMLISTPTFVSV